jgi:anti-anti-sigma regulatory factor
MTDSKANSAPPSRHITLTGSVGIRDGAALRAQLVTLLNLPERVVIDVTSATRVDTAALQLLFAFCRDRKAAGLSIAWEGQSAAWRNALGILITTELAQPALRIV